MVFKECLTTSKIASPVLSEGIPNSGFPGMPALADMEPETSITQHMSSGERLRGWSLATPTPASSGKFGGVRVMRTLPLVGLAQSETVSAVGEDIRVALGAEAMHQGTHISIFSLL
jgi:hypothetical protein